MNDFNIRKATFPEMEFFISQAKREGWNPGIHDAKPFYAIDPLGFFIGCINDEIIGCISAVSYNDDFGFIGFYIISPAYRKQGFGIKLWNHALDYLNQRTIGLDGVLERQKDYEKSHFKFYFKNRRYEGKAPAITTSQQVVDLKSIPFELLLKYDQPIFGISRESFLKQWIQMPNAYSYAKMENGQLRGYGVIRKCFHGHKIGPLFADNEKVAKEIFEGLCSSIDNETVILDVPEINSHAIKIAESYNLKPCFETARMYNCPPPPQLLDKVFGITTFEVG